MKIDPAVQSECEKHGYVLSDILGSGSYAVVRRAQVQQAARKRCERLAEDVVRNRHDKVAVKILDKGRDTRFDRKSRKREASVLEKLDHKHVIYLYEDFETPHRKYLVLEYAQNGQLSGFVYRYRAGERAGLPEDVVRRFTRQLVEGVQYVHKSGIVHRDIKDENVLLDRKFNVKICDFGFATKLKKGDLTDGGDLIRLETYCGSMEFMAPEIIRAEPYNGVLSDIWSFGAVFYTMLAGSRPFQVPLGIDKPVRRELFLQRMEEPLKFDIRQSDEAKDLARLILQVDRRKRPSLKQISRHAWMKGASAPAGKVLERVELHRNIFRVLQSVQRSSCDAQNIPVVKGEGTVGLGGNLAGSEAESVSTHLEYGADIDLDGRKAPSPLHTTPEELSEEEHPEKVRDATANIQGEIDDRMPRRNIRHYKKQEGKAQDEASYCEDQQSKAGIGVKMEYLSRKQKRRRKRDSKHKTRKSVETEKDSTSRYKARKVIGKVSHRERKALKDQVTDRTKMASTNQGQRARVTTDTVKRRSPVKQRATILKKKPKRLGNKKEVRPKTYRKYSPVHTVPSVKADDEYSDDFESDGSSTASKHETACQENEEHQTDGVRMNDQPAEVYHIRKSAPTQYQDVSAGLTSKSRPRVVKTAAPSKAVMPLGKKVTSRQYKSAKAQVLRRQECYKDPPTAVWYFANEDTCRDDYLSPPPEELTTVGDGSIRYSSDAGSASDREQEVPQWEGEDEESECSSLVRTPPKSNRVRRRMEKVSEGDIHTGDRGRNKKRRKMRADNKVKAGGLLPPIDMNWKASLVGTKLPPIDANPAGDVGSDSPFGTDRIQATPHNARRQRNAEKLHLPAINRFRCLEEWP